jgi:membrane protein implicated in regulation of membrane protease activity
VDSRTYSTSPGTVPEQKKLISAKPIYIALAVILALTLLVGSVWGIVWLASTQAAAIEAVRDVLLIAMALGSCLFGVVLLLMLLMIVRLVNMLEFEIKPILEKTNETVGTIRGTTTFVSKNVVKPVTEARVQIAGIRRAFKALFGNPRNNSPR